MTSKRQKRHQKQLKNAMLRSETVWQGKGYHGEVIAIDETADVLEGEVQNFLAEQEQITLERPQELDEGPKAVCTCGWSHGPSVNLYGLGMASKEHSVATGHRMRGL